VYFLSGLGGQSAATLLATVSKAANKQCGFWLYLIFQSTLSQFAIRVTEVRN
jgi:hypothetical protein